MTVRNWKLGCSALLVGTSMAIACGSGRESSNDDGNAGGEAGDSAMTEGGSAANGGNMAKGGSSGSSGEGGDAGAGSGSGGAGGGAGSSGPLPFAPSNISVGDGEGLGDLVLSEQDCIIDTDAGTISCSADDTLFQFSELEQSDGPTLAVFAARSLLIEQSAQVSVHGSRPLVLLAYQEIEIRGGLDATAAQSTVHGGGFAQTPSGKGGGPGGGAAVRNYAAGGGGAYCGKGGLGGFEAEDPPASAGGLPFGSSELVPLFGGASGGGKQGGNEGGAGGGAIQLVAAKSITVGTAGYVSVGGGGGGANGGGAGSGGAILIEAPEVTINGVLAANGGGGAIFNGGSPGQAGQPGAAAALGSAATAGTGSAGDTIDGGDGSNTGNANASGGGGGGAGRIRINTETGEASVGSSATLSPSASTECVTQGTLDEG